jgi:hypothetical protein
VKHTVHDEHREQQILDSSQQKAEKSTRVRKKEIKVPITRGWVNSFVLRHPDEIIQTKSVPQQQHRLQVTRMVIDKTVQNMNEHVQGCMAELVFNLDEESSRTCDNARSDDAPWNISER